MAHDSLTKRYAVLQDNLNANGIFKERISKYFNTSQVKVALITSIVCTVTEITDK